MGVAWDDCTTSTEPTGEERGWELLRQQVHDCRQEECRCPHCGSDVWFSPAGDEHACVRSGCGYREDPGLGASDS